MSAAGSDTFASATPIAIGDTSAATSNAGLTLEAGEPQYGGGSGRTAWWAITPTTATDLTIATAGSDVDTLLSVYTGASLDTLARVAFNDDFGGTVQSQVTVSATASTTYYIQVDTFGSDVGSYVVSVSAPVYGGGNDLFADAVDVPLGTSSAPVDTTAFTLEPGETRPASGQGRTAWWKFTATTTGTVRVDTYYSATPTSLAIYTGSTLSGASLQATANSTTAPAYCDVAVTAGTTYHVQVDTTTSAGSTLAVSLAYLGSNAITVPMGQPDSHYYGHSPQFYTGNALPYVHGNSNTGNDDTPTMGVYSSAPDHALDSTDTTSYIHLNQSGYHGAMIATYPNSSPFYMNAAGTLDYGPAIPDGVTSVTVSLTLTSSSSTSDHTFGAEVHYYDATNVDVGSVPQPNFGTATAGWSTNTVTAQQVTDAASLQAIKAGRMLVFVGPRWTPNYTAPTWVDDFAYLAANFSWSTYDRPPPNGPTVAPPLRQWPRSDALGASSARRLWPLPPSIQASNRKVGGYL